MSLLDLFMNGTKKLVEFLLWDNCNNHCKFCFLKENNPCPSFLDNNGRAKSLSEVHKYITTNWDFGDDILLCGGELFDTPMNNSLKSEFDKLLNTIVTKMLDGSIGYLYINTNLLYDINMSLIYFLTILSINGLLTRLRFTTSYDIYGRFKTDKDRELFFNNVKTIKTMFPIVNIVANIVMTKQFCEEIERGLNISQFQNEYKLDVNLIPYIILTEDMSPERDRVLNTLELVDNQIPGYINTMIDRFTLSTSRKLLKYFEGKLLELTSDNSSCGHSNNFRRYSKSGECFICDVISLRDKLYGRI